MQLSLRVGLCFRIKSNERLSISEIARNVPKKGYHLRRTGTVVKIQQGVGGENTGEDAFRMDTVPSVSRLKVFY